VRLADVSQRPYADLLPRLEAFVPMPLMELTESTLSLHNLHKDYKARKARQESSELHRVETWIASLTSTRSAAAAGLKRWFSVTRSRAASESSGSSIALTLATVCTNAESQVPESLVSRCGGLEEEDEKSGYPSQDGDILGKRAREVEMADSEVRGQTLVHYISILIECFFLVKC
jgi:hypothetical protein